MRRFLAGLVALYFGLLMIGGLLLPANAEAGYVYYIAKCQAPTAKWPYKHTIYQTYNQVWKYLVGYCPYPYQHAGDTFWVAWTGRAWIIPAS